MIWIITIQCLRSLLNAVLFSYLDTEPHTQTLSLKQTACVSAKDGLTLKV